MSGFVTNMPVTTPLGDGLVLAPYAITSPTGEVIATRIAVRLPVNDETRKHLNKSNCITPRATLNGLWSFTEDELQIAEKAAKKQ